MWRNNFGQIQVFISAIPSLCAWQAIAFDFQEIRDLKNPKQFECLFLGDTYYGEVYQDRYRANLEPFLDLNNRDGYDQTIQEFREILESTDLNIANLATPITDMKNSPLGTSSKEYLHKGHAINTPSALKRHGFNVVSLANNHALDYGVSGLLQTQRLLRKEGIQYFGAGDNLNSALQPYLFKVPLGEGREFKVAVIGAQELRESYRCDQFDFYANNKCPGVAPLNIDLIKKLVDDLRKAEPNIFILLFPHWGRDYETITGSQRALAERLKEIGVNAVIGHGSHLAHQVEIEKNQMMAFSLGNFIFNSRGRYKKKFVEAYSVMVKMIKSSTCSHVKFRFYPIFGDNRQVAFIPHFVEVAEFEKVTQYLHVVEKSKPAKKLSKGHNNKPSDSKNRGKLGKDQHGWFFEYKIADHL